MTLQLLTRRRKHDAAETRLAAPVSFVHGRVHELCGPARRTLALMIAARLEGPILWILPGWMPESLSADAMSAWINPARIVFLAAGSDDDILWCTEEALRSGEAPMVVAEVPDPPALTPVRRLHLAAETAREASLSVLLTPGNGGAQGVESRWHIAPAHAPGTHTWTLTRLRARMAPPATWTLAEEAGALRAA